MSGARKHKEGEAKMILKALNVAFCHCFRCASSSKGDNYNEYLSALALKWMPALMKHAGLPPIFPGFVRQTNANFSTTQIWVFHWTTTCLVHAVITEATVEPPIIRPHRPDMWVKHSIRHILVVFFCGSEKTNWSVCCLFVIFSLSVFSMMRWDAVLLV